MSDGTPDAPDTAASSQILDHPFDPVNGEWWAICKHCRLGRAAHVTAVPGAERPPGLERHTEQEIPPVEERSQPHPIGTTCGYPGPAPGLSCELKQGHEGLHKGFPPQVSSRDESSMIQWGKPAPIEQDDPIGGGRVQELLQSGLSVEQQNEGLRQIADPWGAGTRGKVLVDGERQEQHGDPVPNMERIARGWSIISEAQITPQMVPLMMVWFKIVRESQNHGDDNLDDIEGYTEIMRRVVKELGP